MHYGHFASLGQAIGAEVLNIIMNAGYSILEPSSRVLLKNAAVELRMLDPDSASASDVIRALIARNREANTNLTDVQKRCSELLEEIRSLKSENPYRHSPNQP